MFLEINPIEDKEIIILWDINRDLLNPQIENDLLLYYISSLCLVQLIQLPTRACSFSLTLIHHIYTDYKDNSGISA